MAKKQKTPPDADSLRKAVERITKEGYRGTALVAAARLDDALDALIRAQFRPDKPAVTDDFMRSDGPLGSFSARIKLSYLLDLIEPSTRQDLERIRGIRNDFAHARGELRFTTLTIRDRCNQLHAAAACRAGGWIIRSPKHKFVATAYFLAEYIMSFTKPRKRHPALDHSDAYGAWVRRTVKHSSLELLAKELENM